MPHEVTTEASATPLHSPQTTPMIFNRWSYGGDGQSKDSM
jgi:hypothetical protein